MNPDLVPWQSCPLCRERPVSVEVDRAGLAQLLPRGWRPLDDAPGIAHWIRGQLACVECGTRWLVLSHADADGNLDMLAATAPLPLRAEPLLHADTPLTEALPLLRRALRRTGSE